MPWITITEAQVADRMTAAEYSAYTGKYLRPGASSPLPSIITDITARVRGYVAANTSNRLQSGATIPEELRSAALALIVADLCSRLPAKLSDDRKDAKKDALAELKLVSSGAFYVASAAADSLAPDQPQGSIEYFTPDGHTPNSPTLDGLI